ncbi:hypothetical protein [Cellulomonas sp. S1-8]|uniref:hypothetical protein n=1 Tax=Cellulomonas sp. S1-8 TaxID=2904790 RepID=UPI00224371F0|nr:hypothetical protein [Cellulomonas sp. S1-8]UZN03240.1 hypothetical protein OKX07_19675 [Cellulomonas sp. S1-8]
MTSRRSLLAQLPQVLDAGEEVRGTVVAQIVKSPAGNAAKTIATSTVTAVASLALSGGALGVGVLHTARPVWCVTTDRRLLLVEHEGRGPLGEQVLLSLPHDQAHARIRRTLVQGAVITHRESGVEIVRLNLGMKPRAAAVLVAPMAATA